MSDSSTAAPALDGLPTRIIGYAWGDAYVDELLNIALPALLAPGNLPAVASQVQCELVLVSEERLFPRIAGHAAVKAVQQLCPVRLVGLDDLVTRSDKYGMALTYALHRAFADLGPAMTDTWLVFFNADFILADGSLRNLLIHLMRGERIVASPSYCTVKEDVLPELKRRLATDPTKLAIPPREMAELVLRHRHITIRSKTINQDYFHLLQADQFYWQVDDKTLVGRQMPVAIVGMRPQRCLEEPNSFWDHGLMLELCPSAEVKLLGDSDEFLMLELRSGGVAQEQIVPGRADPRDLAERMIGWVTPYQASFAHRPLVLHAEDIPAAAAGAQHQLDAFVTKVLSYAPKFPSHLGHPQWDYHWPDFTRSRHAYLSTRLGVRTQLEEPPATLLSIDRLWWPIDGAEKAHVRRIELLKGAIEEIDRETAVHAAAALKEAVVAGLRNRPTENGLFASRTLDPSTQSVSSGDSSAPVLQLVANQLEKMQDEAEAQKNKLRLAMAAVERQHAGESDELRKAQSEYQRLLQPRVKSAGIPIIRWRAGNEIEPGMALGPAPGSPLFDSPWLREELLWEGLPDPGTLPGEAPRRRLVREASYRIFGRWPRVTLLSPFWPCVQALLAAIEEAKSGGVRDALVVVDAPGIVRSLATLPGKLAQVSPADLGSELFVKALETRQQFDLCVLQLNVDDLPRLSALLGKVAPYMRPGANIIAFHMGGRHPVGALTLDGRKCRVAFTGSAASMRAMRVYSAGFNRIYRGRPLAVIRGLVMLAASIPLALWANRIEAAAGRKGRAPAPRYRTSVTVIVPES